MEITGRIFQINPINDKVVQVVLRKKLNGKDTPIAFAVFGYWKEVVLNELKLKPKDKIRGSVVLKSNLYKGRFYTDVIMKNIEIIQDKPKGEKEEPTNEIDFEGDYIIDEETGEVLL